jgi:hypothetical protein
MRAAAFAALFAMPLCTTPAAAQWSELESRPVGQWTYSALRHDGTGAHSCAVHTHWQQLGRQLRLTAIEQPYSLSLVLRDPALALQPGATGTMRIAIDGTPFSATFVSEDPAIAVVQLAAESAAARRFFAAFRYGNVMSIGMPGGYGFDTGLRGSNAATLAMNDCVDRLFSVAAPPALAAPPPAPAYSAPITSGKPDGGRPSYGVVPGKPTGGVPGKPTW